MKWEKRIFFIFSIYFTLGSGFLGVLSDSDSSVHKFRRPIINYRTRVAGVRYGEPVSTTKSTLIPRLTIKSYKEPKTEIHAPIYDDEEEDISYPEIKRFQSQESSTSRSPTIPNGLKRKFKFPNSARTSTIPPSQDPKPKNSKPKSSRRRKVKRPQKSKSSKTNSTEKNRDSSKDKSSGDKTLALEIGTKDGKYALISQFFGNTSDGKAPGIISYSPSNDFDKDNKGTLGKLDKNDIWLSEGHLLVLKGGDYDSSSRDKWRPIDAYERDKSKPPLRIPLDTDNPPPFPVFVNRTGPPIFLGPPPPFPIPGYGEFNESFDPSRLPPPGLIPLFPNGTIPEFFGPPGPQFHPGNNSFPSRPFPPPPRRPQLPSPPGGLYGNRGPPPGNAYGGGYGDSNKNNETLPPPPPFYPFPPPNRSKNGTFPRPGPFFPFGPGPNGPPPPGFNPNFTDGPFPFFPPLVLNPKDNETDDPSIFLPPPYDFDYYEDNTTIVPPGPFAPGLVVPPPKDFYVVYNKTIHPTSPPSTTPSFPTIYDAVPNPPFKPQRPNARKPNFPITNPPDDSLEQNLPPTPPISTTTVPKKKGRGKFPKRYPKESIRQDSGDSGENPTKTPIIPFISREVTSKPKRPLNYVYVRGKLKSTQEIAEEEAGERGLGNVTPVPDFDELGYPNRGMGDSENTNTPQGPVFPKKKKSRRKEIPKVFFTGQERPRQNVPSGRYSPAGQYLQQTNTVIPGKNPRAQVPRLTYAQNNEQGNQPYQNNQNGQVYFYPNNPYRNPQLSSGVLGTRYFTNNDEIDNSRFSKTQPPQNFQSKYPYYSTNQEQVSPTFVPTVSPPTAYPYPQSFQQPIYQPTLSPLLKRKRLRSRVIFPDEEEPRQQVNQRGQIYRNPLLYQSQQPQPQHGYYSPISQFRTTLSGQFIPNTFFPNADGRALPGTFSTQFFNPQIQQQTSPFLRQEYQQEPQNAYATRQLPQDQGQTVPLHGDILVNYREPLPQYNSESESVSTRSVLKAGPTQAAVYDTQPAGKKPEGPNSPQASFYTFERGGPGGFSYQIRL